MAQHPQLISLAERKRLLRTESELCRQTLRAQVLAWQNHTARLRSGIDALAHYRSLLLVAAPLAGFVFARRIRWFRPMLIRIVAAWPMIVQLWRWQRSCRKSR
jgi:hypothetical protein